MKKKLFIISDIHGNFDAMEKALKESGYDENNEKHLLLVLGDMFDRGSDSLRVYEYLKRLYDSGKAGIVKGNHERIFEDYLSGKTITPFNYYNNGTRETFADFLHETAPFESWWLLNNIDYPGLNDFAIWLKEAREQINNEYPELLGWLENLPYYYETEKYIFTHGAIDTRVENWKEPTCTRYGKFGWEALMWNDGTFFNEPIKNTDKTVVIGHFSTKHLREMYGIDDNGGDSILYRDDNRVIALDTCTILSNKVNVLVVEDELL